MMNLSGKVFIGWQSGLAEGKSVWIPLTPAEVFIVVNVGLGGKRRADFYLFCSLASVTLLL